MKHGTPGCYTNQRCRCKRCRKAWADYMRPRLKLWRAANPAKVRKYRRTQKRRREAKAA